MVSSRDGSRRDAGRRADAAGLSDQSAGARAVSIPFEGKVVSEPSLNADGDRIVCALRVDEMDGAPVRHTVRLYLRSDLLPLEGIDTGQRLSCFGHIWPQDAATNPYEFDAREWLLSDGMTGMAAAKLEDVEVVSCDPGLGGWMIAARRAISDRIGELFPDNAELVHAFVLGDRTGMDSELTERFSQTGITHLICISGMHISVLAVAVSALLNRILPRRAAVAVTLAVILGYGFLIGFPASLIRATVMFASFSIAPVLGRPSDPVTRLATALLGMLAFNPLFILDGGFTLSFRRRRESCCSPRRWSGCSASTVFAGSSRARAGRATLRCAQRSTFLSCCARRWPRSWRRCRRSSSSSAPSRSSPCRSTCWRSRFRCTPTRSR